MQVARALHHLAGKGAGAECNLEEGLRLPWRSCTVSMKIVIPPGWVVGQGSLQDNQHQLVLYEPCVP
jgi:hypothetical protein